FCFFFSSRRRHTRSDRDWSSDVCSSDLDRAGGGDVEALDDTFDRKSRDFVAGVAGEAAHALALGAEHQGHAAAGEERPGQRLAEIGRASCRERVEISVVAGSLKKNREGR